MKVISKYKDYYDFVAKIYGEDPKIVFNRNPQHFDATISYTPLESDFYSGLSHVMRNSHSVIASYHNRVVLSRKSTPAEYYIDGIIVCGKLYIMLHKLINKIEPYQYEQIELLTIQEYFEKYVKKSDSWYTGRINSLCSANDKFIEINKRFNSPVVYLNLHVKESRQNKLDCTVSTNLSLLDRQFETKVDPYQMFQDLQMFITNNLTPEMVTETIDDKYKILQHGFDKQSFRHRK